MLFSVIELDLSSWVNGFICVRHADVGLKRDFTWIVSAQSVLAEQELTLAISSLALRFLDSAGDKAFTPESSYSRSSYFELLNRCTL